MTRYIFLSISIIFLFPYSPPASLHITHRPTRLQFLYTSNTALLISRFFRALENIYTPSRPHLGLKQYFFTFTPIATQKAWVFNHLNFFIRPKTIHFPLQNNLLTFFLGVNIQVIYLTPKSSQVNLLEWQNLCYISK